MCLKWKKIIKNLLWHNHNKSREDKHWILITSQKMIAKWKKNMMWHMPHGITLLATPKNNVNFCLLFEQPSSGHFHATPCVSSYLCTHSHDLLASTKSTHCYFSPRSEGTNASSSSSSCLHSWWFLHNLLFVTTSPVWRLSSRIPQALILFRSS